MPLLCEMALEWGTFCPGHGLCVVAGRDGGRQLFHLSARLAAGPMLSWLQFLAIAMVGSVAFRGLGVGLSG